MTKDSRLDSDSSDKDFRLDSDSSDKDFRLDSDSKLKTCEHLCCHASLPPAPIGSVEVSISCSSSGAMRASCSSEGDQILYSWTLNEDPLMDGNSSIDLNEGTDGNIICSVKNHVSHGQKTVSVKPCPGELLIHECPHIYKNHSNSNKSDEDERISQTCQEHVQVTFHHKIPYARVQYLWCILMNCDGFISWLFTFSWFLRVLFFLIF